MRIRDLILSARVLGIVMNFPLYDGHVSDKARRLIADGKLNEALAEYRRLAELGSDLSKCILAYLNLRDSPYEPRNLDRVKSLAGSALQSEPGYANYVLSYVATLEGHAAKAIDLMCESYKAHFIPAASALGLILAQGYGVSKHPKEAEIFFWRAIRAGHVPAPMLLCRFYMRRNSGIAKGILGLIFLPLAFLYAWICTRFLVFSIYTFRHFNVAMPPMFNERALSE